MAEKVVLAYSGGLDTSIIIPWLKENYAYDVIAMVGDVGQGDDIEAVVEKAYKTGASKAIVEDMREEFLSEYVFPALKAGAVYEHKYLLGTSLARPVIAKHQVEVALREGATAVALEREPASVGEPGWRLVETAVPVRVETRRRAGREIEHPDVRAALRRILVVATRLDRETFAVG